MSSEPPTPAAESAAPSPTSAPRDEWSGHFEGQRAAMLGLLEELVVQNSYSRSPAGGERVAHMLMARLGALADVSPRLVQAEGFAPHVLACSQAALASPNGCVALVGHHDTVFPPGSFEGFEVEGDIARGPGVLDMKGGLTVALFALEALAQRGLLARLPLRLVIVSDEEVGSPDSTALLEDELSGASCALVFEAGRAHDAIITARKGTGSIVASVHGRAAHAGNNHQQGANAIWALSRLIDRVQNLTDYERGVTVSVGTIKGGEARNTVPDHAEAAFDLRFIRTEDGETLVNRFGDESALAIASMPGTRVTLRGGIARPPLQRSDANVALYQEYAACAKAAGLGHGEASLVGGGSDASTTAALGVPSIDGLGPRGAGFHTRDEYIEIPTLMQRAEALARFLAGRVPVR